jgi:DNA mismatch repair protein MutS
VTARGKSPPCSILFDRPHPSLVWGARTHPAYFADLNLDQVVAAVTAGRDEYDLAPYFSAPLPDVAAVRYRQDVLRDIERGAVKDSVRAFAQTMRTVRGHLAQAHTLRYKYQKESWFLDAVSIYCGAVTTLASDLTALRPGSSGLQALRDYMVGLTASGSFVSLQDETRALQADLAGITYCVQINGNRVNVSMYDGERDYSQDIEETFAKFKRDAVKDYRIKLPDWVDMNHVESRVLDLVAELNADLFLCLDDYAARHQGFLDQTVREFDREVQFYLAYLEHMERLTAAGLRFCYPDVSSESREIHATEAFDIALAAHLVSSGSFVVCNDLVLEDPERVLVITGPNQGGKTTFARMFGQLHHLASLGLPVPGRTARLFLADQMFTHFDREEDLSTLRGKLEDELVGIHDTLERATVRSIIILNESFTSTTLEDARFIGTRVLTKIVALGALCVYVTFVDELTTLGPAIVSMVSAVQPDDAASRTYKVVRKPADGLAYAAAIAEKYGLGYESLRRRVAP